MESALTSRWLRGLSPVSIVDEASVSEAREQVRQAGARIGLPEVVVASLVTAASELAHNQLAHAKWGKLAVRPLQRDGTPGIELVASDAGPGIAHPTSALAGGRSTGSGLGIGLAGVKSLCDELDFDVRLSEGTCVWARKFAAPLPRRRQVAVLSRPLGGERVSGDDAMFVRAPDGGLTLAAADGLGHGPEARVPATAAIESAMSMPGAAPEDQLARAHAALKGTRGAVMAVATVGASGQLVLAAAGNVTGHVVGRGSSRRFGGSSWVLGQTGRVPSPTREEGVVAAAEAVILFSDGLSSKLGFEAIDDLLREPPLVIAHALLERYQRVHDDALIVVAR
jgi:anti-sigma regulatory factor (Ser/Thr protein kinase)